MSVGNTLATATRLNLIPNSTLDVPYKSVYSFAPDFYSFTLAGRSSLSLSLEGADFELLDNQGNTLTINGIAQKSENPVQLLDTINVDDLQAGTYYIRVYTESFSSTPHYLQIENQSTAQADILWRYNAANSANAGKLDIWRMNGTTLSQTDDVSQRVTDRNWQVEATGDFNQDGQSDLLWRYYGNNGNAGRLDVWLMNGSTLVQSLTLNAPKVTNPDWRVEGVGDFNGDSQIDILWRQNGVIGSVGRADVWLLNGQTSNFSLKQSVTVAQVGNLKWQIEGVGDFNHDGKADILWRNLDASPNGGRLDVWLMDGTALSQSVTLNTLRVANPDWQIEGVGDFNQDGQFDLLWRYKGTSNSAILGKTDVWLLNGQADGFSLAQSVTIAQTTSLDWQIDGVLTRYSVPPRIDTAGSSNKSLNLGTLQTTGEFYGFVGSGDTEDYYSIGVGNTGNVQISVESLSGDADLELLTYDPVSQTFKVLGSSQNSGNIAEILSGVLQGVTIRVFAKNGVDTRYRLNLSTTPVLDLNGAVDGVNYDAKPFIQGGGAVRITDSAALTLTNTDLDTFIGATVTLRSRPNGAAEVLAADTSGTGISAIAMEGLIRTIA